MIAPRADLELRSERPAMRTPVFHFLVGRMAARLIRRRMTARADARMDHVRSLLVKVRECQTRESLEVLLGPPRYAMSGERYSSASADRSVVLRPDVVEVYEKDGCAIELWFNKREISCVTGWPLWTTWENIAVATDRNLRRQEKMPKGPVDDAST